MTRIFLIGFMASGKTTLGRALAQDLNLQFIDMDSYIENRFCKSVSTLFAERGEEAFRRIEHQILHEVADIEDVVISTGGGTPCFFDNMDYMNAHGTTVFLQASPEVLFTRLTISRTQRPLVASKTGDELRAYIQTSLSAREPFYAKAHHIFCSDTLEDKHQIATSVALFKQQILGSLQP